MSGPQGHPFISTQRLWPEPAAAFAARHLLEPRVAAGPTRPGNHEAVHGPGSARGSGAAKANSTPATPGPGAGRNRYRNSRRPGEMRRNSSPSKNLNIGPLRRRGCLCSWVKGLDPGVHRIRGAPLLRCSPFSCWGSFPCLRRLMCCLIPTVVLRTRSG